MIFLHLFDSSKTTAGLTASLLWVETGGDCIEFRHFDVSADFTLQLPIQTPLTNQRREPARRES
jgi:hypothetical protein